MLQSRFGDSHCHPEHSFESFGTNDVSAAYEPDPARGPVDLDRKADAVPRVKRLALDPEVHATGAYVTGKAPSIPQDHRQCRARPGLLPVFLLSNGGSQLTC